MPSRAQRIDRYLGVEVTRQNQNIILGWFASNGAPYQVESSPTLSNWVDSSLVITGRGSWLFSTNPMGRLSRNFYRVKRLAPGLGVTATFDPWAGLLTIIGDSLPNSITVRPGQRTAHLAESFAKLNGQHKLVFVDWCHVTSATSDGFESLFSDR